ncbi:MAG: hypothetical protein NVSMB6_27420 [Burkholderiaceae bacterium]
MLAGPAVTALRGSPPGGVHPAAPIGPADTAGILSHADTDAITRLETDLLLEGLYQLHGADFRGYARAPLAARLQAHMDAERILTISAIQDCIMRSREQTEKLVRALSFPPVGMFDDPPSQRALRELLGPYLRSCALPKIWIAESTSAEEVFALVIMLIEEELYDKTLIFVTAADDGLLAETRRGVFSADLLAQYDAAYRQSGGRRRLADYCSEQQGQMAFAPSLRSNLIWAQYGLATDRSFNEFQLIVCRRVLPELGASLRRRSLRLFADSLSPFGILHVDVSAAADDAAFNLEFQAVSPNHGLYRRRA